MLNRFIFDNYKKQLKEIKITFIYRLIDFTEKSYKKPLGSRNEQENISIRLKNDLLMLEYEEEIATLEDRQKIKDLIDDIHTFKRVNQRYRGNTTSKKTEKSNKIKIGKKCSNMSSSSERPSFKEETGLPELSTSGSNNMVEEKNVSSYLEVVGEQPELGMRGNRLDNLDGNISFLHHKESTL
jgi:predicted RNA-binding protein